MASSGVNIKMGVTGVAKFKQDISTARQQIKTMDADLGLLEKQFKASGDAEAYMQRKTELLQAKLEEQKIILDKAERALKDMKEKGVSPASSAFQDMQRQVIAAKGSILDTQDQLEKVGSAALGTAGDTEYMNEQLANVGKQVSVQNVVDGLGKITDGMEKAAKKAVDLGKKIMKDVLGVGSWADDINTRSTVLGVSPEELQRMEKTARIIDTDAETIIKARQKLMKGVGSGNKGTMSALGDLGVEYLGDAEDTFWKAGEAIMNLTDEAEQEAKANDLFGRSWHDLIPLFKAGREEYEKTNAAWNVMTKEELDELNKMDDEYQKLQIQLEDLKRTALSELAEPMKLALTEVNKLLGQIGDWLKSDEGKATVENVITKITDGVKWLVEHGGTVVTAMGAIVAGWGALKLTGTAMKIYELVTGLKGLDMSKVAKAAEAAGGAGKAASSAGKAAAVGGGVKGAIAANGLSLLAPLAVLGTAITPALIAQAADVSNARNKQAARIASAANLKEDNSWFLTAAANALGFGESGNDVWGNMGQVDSLLMGMKNRSDLQKAQLYNLLNGSNTSYGSTWNELNRFWSGEPMDQVRVNEILQSVADAYDRMAQETEASQKASESSQDSSDELTKAVKDMPDAVSKGISNWGVYLDGQVVGRLVAPAVSEQLAGSVLDQ